MRKAFVSSLIEIAKNDDRIILLTADLGFMVLESFQEQFPDRFYNVGVMEQNMVALATGLAMQGYIPFVYSIATFATLRCYEFIRNGPVVHNLPVRIVGVGTGVDYSFDGLSHYALEDIGVLRTLPSLTIVSPADSKQAANALQQTWDHPGPVYYRISKNDALSVVGLDGSYHHAEIELLCSGKDAVLLTTGSVTQEVLQAAKRLREHKIYVSVAVISTLQPFPTKDVQLLLSGYAHAFSFEPHGVSGGLGSLLSEVIADNKLGCQLIRTGISYRPKQVLGSQSFLHNANSLDVDGVVTIVEKVLAT